MGLTAREGNTAAMEPGRVAEIRAVLQRVEEGAEIAVNGYGPWTVVSTGVDTDADGGYVDRWWLASDEGGKYYRIWANDSGRRLRAVHEDVRRGPGWYRSNPTGGREGGANAIHRLTILDGGETIVSDTVAADVVDGTR